MTEPRRRLPRPGPMALAAALVLGLGASACRQPAQPPRPSVPEPAPPRLDPPERARIPANRLNLPPGTQVPEALHKLPLDAQREYLRGVWEEPHRKRQEVIDRKELVRPAPADFKSDGKEKSFKLALIPFETKFKLGESFWYRLEMQNTGVRSINWIESGSFFKSGYKLGDRLIKLFVTTPDGREVKAAASRVTIGSCSGRSGMKQVLDASGISEDDARDLFTKATIEGDLRRGLRIALAPGETLVTRPWFYDDACLIHKPRKDAPDLLKRGWREWPWDRDLYPNSEFKPGSYKLRFVLDDPVRPPPSEEKLARLEKATGISRANQLRHYETSKDLHLGSFSSNSVTVEVVP